MGRHVQVLPAIRLRAGSETHRQSELPSALRSAEQPPDPLGPETPDVLGAGAELVRSFKEMDQESREDVLGILNMWWREENMPEEMLRARVVLLYKKGDTNKYANYRPIALLNTM